MLTWNLLLAGAGIGIAQVVLAKLHGELERVNAGIGRLPPGPASRSITPRSSRLVSACLP